MSLSTKVIVVTVMAAFSLSVLAACSRPLVQGRDREMEPLTRSYQASSLAVFDGAEEALEDMGYKVEYANKYDGVLRTGWQSTTIDSHYIELFDRADYGTNGSYYYLALRIEEKEPGKSTVTITAPIRGIIGIPMKSSHRIERKVLSRIEDNIRPADIEVTNIGVVEKR